MHLYNKIIIIILVVVVVMVSIIMIQILSVKFNLLFPPFFELLESISVHICKFSFARKFIKNVFKYRKCNLITYTTIFNI